jgi:hypothetical protein
MINASKSEKTLVSLIDHTNFLKALREVIIVKQRNAPSRVEINVTSIEAFVKVEASSSSPVLVTHKKLMQNIQYDDIGSDEFEFYTVILMPKTEMMISLLIMLRNLSIIITIRNHVRNMKMRMP